MLCMLLSITMPVTPAACNASEAKLLPHIAGIAKNAKTGSNQHC